MISYLLWFFVTHYRDIILCQMLNTSYNYKNSDIFVKINFYFLMCLILNVKKINLNAETNGQT